MDNLATYLLQIATWVVIILITIRSKKRIDLIERQKERIEDLEAQNKIMKEDLHKILDKHREVIMESMKENREESSNNEEIMKKQIDTAE